ncbi:ACP phosphodiesterase [Flavobacterium sp. W21_SRS_FM6]|uniref:acyl carrier protein phosphodiesterase n=1 Tax=Flavobacterium sp. W21_SRS_FM6 TaxID=3240268 RepID=UPI003F8FF340
MNYIAHIHIANHTQTSLLGNFLGDFVKGSSLIHLPRELAIGVQLHRKVDSFTDNHELVKNLRKMFPSELRRVAGIIIDITFDYLLMQQWDGLTLQTKEQVLTRFYHQLSVFDGIDTHHFKRLSHSLVTDRWLLEYQQADTCLRAMKSIERRLNNKIIFADTAYVFFLANLPEFETTFTAFYPELLIHGVHYSQQLRSI